MYKLTVLLVSTCVIAAILVSGAEAAFGEGLFTCKEGHMVPGEKLSEKLKACNDPEKYVDKDVKCISVCTTEAIGGMKDGIPDKELFINLVKTEFPEAAQATALESVEKCFEDRTFDKDDQTCSSIADFSACGTKLVIDTTCESPEPSESASA